MFEFIFKNLKEGAVSEWNPKDADWKSKGVLRRYAQNDFSPAMFWENSSLSPFGYVFYPNRCYEDASIKCKVHIHMHGCYSAIRHNGVDRLIKDYLGFNAYAAANDIIIVYPDVQISEGNLVGCADTIGYTGKDY